MDVLTHGLAGALVARAVVGPGSWPVVAAAVAGALAPDVDVVARLWDPMAPITVHRTATHSFAGGLPLAGGVAGIVKLRARHLSFPALAGFAYLGVLSHIGLDLLTPFGTAALWPLSPRRFGLGWLYVLDPVVLGLVVGGLLLAWNWTGHRVAAPRWALWMLAAYALVAGMLGGFAVARWEGVLAARGIPSTRVAVVPSFPGPWRWVGVAETDVTLYRASFWLAGGSTPQLASFSKEPLDGLTDLEALPEVQAFRAFARVPWFTATADGDAQVVEFRDLAFQDHPFGGPMALRLRLDRSGAVTDIELGHKL
ncbi:MAG: metal-dependent hydrolase [Candidatus Rokuibacteriota bacterium]